MNKPDCSNCTKDIYKLIANYIAEHDSFLKDPNELRIRGVIPENYIFGSSQVTDNIAIFSFIDEFWESSDSKVEIINKDDGIKECHYSEERLDLRLDVEVMESGIKVKRYTEEGALYKDGKHIKTLYSPGVEFDLSTSIKTDLLTILLANKKTCKKILDFLSN